MNCAGTGTHARITGDIARCPSCDATWPPDSLIGGKIPAHPETIRVRRTSDPESFDVTDVIPSTRRPGAPREG